MKLYKDLLIEHYKNPKNYGKLKNPDFSSEILNPSCGDEISFEAKVNDNVITEIAFQGKGCIISQATASMLSEYAKSKTLIDLESLSKSDILKLIDIQLGPTRLRCATLPLEALQEGIRKYKGK